MRALDPALGQVCKELSLEERRGTKGSSLPRGHQLREKLV